MRIPKDFPVRALTIKDDAVARVTCLTCGRSWDDSISTAYTPTPGGRCPFEAFHDSAVTWESFFDRTKYNRMDGKQQDEYIARLKVKAERVNRNRK